MTRAAYCRAVLYRIWRTAAAAAAIAAVAGYVLGRAIDRAVTSIARN